MELEGVRSLLEDYGDLEGAMAFFKALGYPVSPRAWSLEEAPARVREGVRGMYKLVGLEKPSFALYQVELEAPPSRTKARLVVEQIERDSPRGDKLFVFTQDYETLLFVHPRPIQDPRDPLNPLKIRLWLRFLEVDRNRPYRTDLEVLARLGAGPSALDEAFSVERVTEGFFRDYREAFGVIQDFLRKEHPENPPEWARDYTHQLLNRIMFLYFIARKGWLLGPDGKPDRDFMRHFFEAYRASGAKDEFHSHWLPVLFFEAFNGKWQNREENLRRFPRWLVHSMALAPYLNGGLYTPRPGLDDRLKRFLPDAYFGLLFERWTDGTFPGLFERYNFTVVETGRLEDEVAVDPEMLGTVYERLVNVAFEGEEDPRGDAGIFYTPRVEIDLMGRLALVDWLGNRLGEKELLYRWVLALSEDEREEAEREIGRKGLWEALDEGVRRVRVCDPACGSGSFLVGMMLVLDELQARCNRALGRGETPYERRKRILRDQLYGVDVMEWAVRVAELRLWLQLVVETELGPEERRFAPLLPNLDLKLRPGDSLLQTLGGLDLSPFRRSELPLPPHLKKRLKALKERKRRFFQGEEPGLTADLIRHEEAGLFRDILQEKVHELERRIAEARRRMEAGPQGLFPGEAREGRPPEEEVEALTEEKARYERALQALRPSQPLPFVWDLSFVEVFEDEDPGFDLVIGNPPYVRQERIRDHLGRFGRRDYLDQLNEGLRAVYPGFMGKGRRISGRADYYVYFYLHGLSLLADGGTFCFITSNSWLDVDFGKDLQEFFLRHGHLKMVIDNHAKRSFAQADVNTVIVLAGPPERKRALSKPEMERRKVRFVSFKVPFEEALSPVVFMEIEDDSLYRPLAGLLVLTRKEYRAVLRDQWSLYQEGLEEEGEEGEKKQLLAEYSEGKGSKYVGNKWGGKYLRAPDIFFTLLEKGKGKLVRLGDIAEVRFGIKTGANDFFYLEPLDLTVKEVAELAKRDPKAPVRVRNGAGWEGEIEAAWLRPVVKSPREIKTLRVRLEDLRYLVFMPPEEVRRRMNQGQEPLEGYPLAGAYIRWGEGEGYSERPTCRSREWWWDLGYSRNGPVAWAMIHSKRHNVHYNPDAVQLDHNFFELKPHDGHSEATFAAICVSTLSVLVKELFGRQYGGGSGPIKNEGIDIANFAIVVPSAVEFRQAGRLVEAFNRLVLRSTPSFFEELGFSLCQQRRRPHPEHPYEHVHPETLTLEQVRQASPDRFELDSVVFDVLGLTEEERLEVYRAVARLVKERLVKARNV